VNALRLEGAEWIGISSSELFTRIVQADDRAMSVRFFAPPRKVSLQERVSADPGVNSAIELALQLRREREIPFWDAILVASQQSDIPKELWQEALFHRSASDHVHEEPVRDLDGDRVRKLSSRLPTDRVLAVSSLVRCRDRSWRHVPMLDFRWKPSDRNLQLLAEVVSAARLRGFIVESGHSYHYYGANLIEAGELPAFLGGALLWGLMVDRRWVAHQLIEGACALRVSSKKPGSREDVPRVVMTVDWGQDS
jgi:hypothetical protein